MRQLGAVLRPGPALAGVALMFLGISIGGMAGCTLLLDTTANPYKCSTDDDCKHFPNAACDNARKQCVPRLPNASGDSGPPDDGAGGTSGLTCELTFDNKARLSQTAPDGGLRPLPDGAP
jgi:hypothetical protein